MWISVFLYCLNFHSFVEGCISFYKVNGANLPEVEGVSDGNKIEYTYKYQYISNMQLTISLVNKNLYTIQNCGAYAEPPENLQYYFDTNKQFETQTISAIFQEVNSGTYINCIVLHSNEKAKHFILKFVLQTPDRSVMPLPGVQNTPLVGKNKFIPHKSSALIPTQDQNSTKKQNLNEVSKRDPGTDINSKGGITYGTWTAIGVVMLILIIAVLWALVIVMKNWKHEAQQMNQTDMDYQNLPLQKDGPMSFPPQQNSQNVFTASNHVNNLEPLYATPILNNHGSTLEPSYSQGPGPKITEHVYTEVDQYQNNGEIHYANLAPVPFSNARTLSPRNSNYVKITHCVKSFEILKVDSHTETEYAKN